MLIGVGAGVAVLALIAGGFFVLSGGKRGGKDQAAQARPAQLAGQIFATDPAATTDGRDQRLNAVAAADATVVAVGSESDTLGDRAQFLVSADGGRTFRLAPVRTPAGGEAAYGDTPGLVAGGTGAWVALGSHKNTPNVWTSKDGRIWTKEPGATGAAFGAADRVLRLAWTGSGFIAVGDTSAKGDFSDARPVVWLSADGHQWQRIADQQLPMTVPSGYLSLAEVVAHGDTVLVHAFGATPGGAPGSIDSVWRSTNGGRSWQQSSTPAETPISFGIALTAAPGGFLLARTAVSGNQRSAVVLQSADGSQWTPVGEIHLPGYRSLLRIGGSDRGLVATVEGDHKLLLARSTDARTWQSAGEIAEGPGQTFADTAATAGTTIVVGTDGARGDAILDLLDTQGRAVPSNLPQIPGAAPNDQIVDAMATSTGRTVAVGSTNGDAAIWYSTDGRQWTRSQTGLGGTGRRRLLSVASGPAGWLAVGYGNQARTAPLLVTSQDGTVWQPDHNLHPDSLSLFGAASGPAGYVIVGAAAASAETWHSGDLKNWARGTSAHPGDLEGTSASPHWMHGVTGGQFGYVAVGGLNDPSAKTASERPAVWTSADGSTWAMQQLPLPGGSSDASLHQVAAKGNTVIATGTASAPNGWAVFADVSADGGKTWQQTQLPQGTGNSIVTALTATPRGWVIAGSSGPFGQASVVLWSSADGHVWNMDRPQGTGLSGNGDNWLTALTTIGNNLVGTGIIADYQGERLTLWQRPLP